MNGCARLRDNDALWLVIFALQYYDSLYRQFPKAIAAEAAAIMTRTRETADAQMRAGVEQAKADLARAVALAAQDVARDVARRQATQWLAYGMAVGAALVVTGNRDWARAGAVSGAPAVIDNGLQGCELDRDDDRGQSVHRRYFPAAGLQPAAVASATEQNIRSSAPVMVTRA